MGMDKTVGERLIDRLEAMGIAVAFGIPGVHNLELYRGLKRSSIRHVAARHEQGLGFMADGYARASGKPAVCLTITGPGLTNIASAMAQALADSVPMLVISTENRRSEIGSRRGFLHEMPAQFALASHVARASFRLEDAESLEAVLDRVHLALTQGRRGPVYLEIPRDVLSLKAVDSSVESERARAAPVAAASEVLDEAALQTSLAWLSQAQRPLLMVGGGARQAEIETLADRLQAPTVMTINARGLLKKDHPLAVPASPSLQAVRQLVSRADVVVAIGTEFGQTDYDMYAVSDFQKPAKLIRVDIDAAQLTRNITADLGITADAETWVHELLTRLPATRDPNPEWVSEAHTHLHAAWQELNTPQQRQVTFLETLCTVFNDPIIIGDSTQPVYSGNLYFSPSSAGAWFNSATGYGTLGYALPASNGACLARSSRDVICLTGDGGLQFTLSELAVTRDEGVCPLVMVWNNRSFKEIRHSMLAVGIEPEGVDVTPPRLDKIAAAYDLDYRKIEGPKDLVDLAADYRAKRRAVLVEIIPGEME